MFCVWVFDKWNEYYYIILGFFLLLILIILYKYDEILLFYSWYNNSRIFVLMIACVVFVITVALFINKKLSDRIDNNIGKSILFLCIITVAQFIYNLAATRNTIYEKILGFDEKPLFFVCENYDYIFLLLLVSVLQIFSYISCYIAGLRLFFVFVGFDCVNKDIGSYFSKSIIDINDKGNLRLVTAFEKKFNTPIANEQNFLLVYVIKYICIFVSIVGVILPLFLYGNGMRNPFYWQNLARVNVVVREDLHLSDNYLFSADLLRRTENGVYIRGNLYCTISGCYKYNNDAILKIVPKYIIKNEKGSVVIGISREELPIIDWAICKQKCFDYMEFTKKYMEYKVCHIRN